MRPNYLKDGSQNDVGFLDQKNENGDRIGYTEFGPNIFERQIYSDPNFFSPTFSWTQNFLGPRILYTYSIHIDKYTKDPQLCLTVFDSVLPCMTMHDYV